MKTFWKLFRKLDKYRVKVLGNVLSNVLVALFTVVSIPTIIPFFEILFEQVDMVAQPVPFAFNLDNLAGWSKYQYSHLIIEQGQQTALLYICGLIVFIFFFKNLFRYLSLAFLVPVRNGIVRDLRQDLYQKILGLPMSYYTNERKGDLIARFSTDVQEIENSILNVIEVLVKSPLIITGCILFMLYVSPALTLFVFILILFTALIIGGISRTLKKNSAMAQAKLGGIISTVDETIGGLKIVKGFGAEKFFSRHFSSQNTAFKDLLNRILWRRDLSSPLSEFLGIATVAVLLWYGSNQVFNNQLEPSTFFAFIFAFFSVIEPAKSFAKAYYDIQKGLAAADRVDEVMTVENHIEDPVAPKPIHAFNKAIAFKNVSFRYSSYEPLVLKNISFEVPKGKVVALVGASGSGKTTIVDLISRFYDVTEGQILIDDNDIRHYLLADLRKQIAVVSQDPVVFNDTIFNNITFGKENVSQHEIEQAARIAHAHEFICATDDGYASVIGDRGVKLSGGQRQRLTLARAVLKNAPILILDEATSALDSESEKLVQDALKKMLKNRTVIIIAHRLATIQHADIIFVLKGGEIIEAGQHLELMEKNGEYRKFVKLQAF
ncbi:MAG: ABC transporter ATP-binding protein [Saprospiraceae bacterium]|nr:ABC transporter ATP-binding protein [Saprospiraceae bacterium]